MFALTTLLSVSTFGTMTTTWFVTGAGSGIGLDVTRQLLDRGDHVVATVRSANSVLDSLAGDRLRVATMDVTDPEAVEREVNRAFDAGRVDVVFSCAGSGLLGAAEELTEDLVARQIDVNLAGPIRVVRAAAPRLRAQGGGRIVQMSSSGGEVPDPGMSVYNATKFGVEGFFESVAIELRPFGIDVTLIAPGGTRTAFISNITRAEPLPAYDSGVLGMVRTALTGALDQPIGGDPARIASVIINAAESTPAPRRVVLGGTAYESVEAALEERLAALRAQKELAFSV
jgi:NAD(P)-dependent dehydrogenase (short-subunit alcohol dehydrogenase family)